MEKQNKYTILQGNAISRACYKCTPLERQLLFYATMHTQKTKDGYYCNFALSDFIGELNTIHTTSTKRNVLTAIKQLCEKHNNITILNNENDYIATVWIQKAQISIKANTVFFFFSNEIGKRLFNLKSHFTYIDFRIITLLKSYYSIRLYEIMLSYKGFQGKKLNYANQWYFSLTVDDVKQLFELSEKAKTNDITSHIIKPAITELNSINSGIAIELVIIPAKTDRRKIGAYNFYCTEIDKSTFSLQTENNIVLQPTAEIIKLERNISTMKSKYFNEYLNKAVEIGGKKPYENQIIFDKRVLEALEKDGFNFE